MFLHIYFFLIVRSFEYEECNFAITSSSKLVLFFINHQIIPLTKGQKKELFNFYLEQLELY